MTFDQFLTLVIIVGGMLGIITFGTLRMLKAQKSGGTIDQEEQIELLEFFRSRILELVKVALELQRLNKIGKDEVTDYVIEKVYTEIQATDILNDTEKAIITPELIARFVELLGDEYAKVVEDFNAEEDSEVGEPEEDNHPPSNTWVTMDEVEAVSLPYENIPTELSDLVHRGSDTITIPLSEFITEVVDSNSPSVEALEIPNETETIEVADEVEPVAEVVENIEETVAAIEAEVKAEWTPESQTIVDAIAEAAEENIAETMNDDVADITPVSEEEKEILG